MTSHIKPHSVRLIAPGGPVSRAVATMAAAHRTPVLTPEFDPEQAEFYRLKEALRAQIERDFDRIDRCLVLLDAIDGDDDRNADYTTTEMDPAGNLYTLGRSSDDEDGTDAEGFADDNGIGDKMGLAEQLHRHSLALAEADRRGATNSAGHLGLIQGGHA